jgi:hypothetical protein
MQTGPTSVLFFSCTASANRLADERVKNTTAKWDIS